jgi:Histidine kinase-, DNA gyrase B-, and HSP90-like ATPase
MMNARLIDRLPAYCTRGTFSVGPSGHCRVTRHGACRRSHRAVRTVALPPHAHSSAPAAFRGRATAATVNDGGLTAPDVLEHAFEPFFTMKEAGTGTGLGLSMVHDFAEQFDGTATIQSEVGRGTSITIYLPRAERPSVDTGPSTAPAALPSRCALSHPKRSSRSAP